MGRSTVSSAARRLVNDATSLLMETFEGGLCCGIDLARGAHLAHRITVNERCAPGGVQRRKRNGLLGGKSRLAGEHGERGAHLPL